MKKSVRSLLQIFLALVMLMNTVHAAPEPQNSASNEVTNETLETSEAPAIAEEMQKIEDPEAQRHLELLQAEEDPYSEKDMPEELKALAEASVDINKITLEDSKDAVEQLMKFDYEGPLEPIKINVLSRLRTKALLLGVRPSIAKMLNEPLKRLSLESDPELKVYVAAGRYPGVSLGEANKVLTVSLGSLGYMKNQDEVAALLSVAIERAKARVQDVAKYHSSRYQEVENIAESRNLSPTQLEYLKADLRAVDRLIHAGYNPFALYDIYKRLTVTENNPFEVRFKKWFNRTFKGTASDMLSDAPLLSLRMSTVKGYVAWRQEQQDLHEHVSKYQHFTRFEKLVSNRFYLYQLSETNIHFSRAQLYTKTLISLGALYVSGKAISNLLKKVGDKSVETMTTEKLAREKPNEAMADTLQLYSHSVDSVILGILDKVESFVRSSISESAADLLHVTADYYMRFSDLITMIKDYTIRNPDVILILGVSGAGVGLLGWVMIADYRRHLRLALKEDPIDTSKLRLAEANAKKMISIIGDLKDKDRSSQIDFVIRMSGLMANMQKEIYRLYTTNNAIRRFKLFSGLTGTYYRSQYVSLRLLSAAKRLIETAPTAEEKLQIFNQISAHLDKLPPATYEGLFTKHLLKSFSQATKEFRAYDISALSDGFPNEVNPEERAWETKLRLMTYPWFKMTTAQKVAVVVQLSKLHLIKSAVTMVALFRVPIMTYIFSEANKDAGLPKELLSVIHRFKHKIVLNKPGMLMKQIYHHGVIGELLYRQATSQTIADNLGSASLSKQIPVAPPFFTNIRWYMNMAKTRELKKYIKENFQSLSDMSTFMDKELVNKNVIMDSYSGDISRVISQNPEMITSMKDVESLLAKEYYWPKMGQTGDTVQGVEEMLMLSILEMKAKYPQTWKYEPAACERLHNLIIDKMKAFGYWSEDPKWKAEIWKKLVTRGVTSTTDLLFIDIYDRADATLRAELERYATDQGAVWEPRIKAQIARNLMNSSSAYQELLMAQDPQRRLALLAVIVADLKKSMPERGFYFQEILEEISVRINSSEKESSFIQTSKVDKVNSNNAKEDMGLRIISDIMGDVMNWRKKNQYDFLLYLIGKGPVTKKIEKSFKTVGPERVRRTFQLLPVMQKTTFLDTLLDSSTGLMPSGKVTKGYGKKIVEFLLEGRDENMQKVSRQILESFFESLGSVGNRSLGTYILAYILSLPSDEVKTAGHVLKSCLEVMGLTGVKIAQFLAASEILSPEDTAILRGSQEKANPPIREDIFKDLRSIFGGREMPFEVMELLGSASVKYTMRGIDNKTGKEIALKIFRNTAFTKANQQFRVLRGMSSYMIEHFGQEYAIVKTIVNASIEAVKKELDAKAEVQKSDRARLTLYPTRVNGNRLISVPRDVWVHYRMIVAEFAKGTSLYNNSIPDDVRISMAEEILAMETDILFADKDVIEFEPDRHAGNLRMSYEKVTKKEQIRPIDFGQLSKITRENRQRIYDLFALAQIIRNVGVTQEAIRILKDEYPVIDEKKTEKVLRIYFAGKQPSELNAYFSVLSSLEEGGQKIDASLLDFMRAILQLKPYETLLPTDSKAPKVTAAFQQKVEASVEKYRGRIASAITTSESAKVAWKKWRSGEMKTGEIMSAMKAKIRAPKVISCQRVLLP